jgi:hypothetical protein
LWTSHFNVCAEFKLRLDYSPAEEFERIQSFNPFQSRSTKILLLVCLVSSISQFTLGMLSLGSTSYFFSPPISFLSLMLTSTFIFTSSARQLSPLARNWSILLCGILSVLFGLCSIMLGVVLHPPVEYHLKYGMRKATFGTAIAELIFSLLNCGAMALVGALMNYHCHLDRLRWC